MMPAYNARKREQDEARREQQADPAMPEDRVGLDFEFHNRAN